MSISKPTPKQQEVRRLFPTIARAIDQFREHFPDTKVTWARENGNEAGIRAARYDDDYPPNGRDELP